MIVSSDAASRVVSLLDYRRNRAQADATVPAAATLPMNQAPRPVTARQARHRARMLDHLASLTRSRVPSVDPVGQG